MHRLNGCCVNSSYDAIQTSPKLLFNINILIEWHKVCQLFFIPQRRFHDGLKTIVGWVGLAQVVTQLWSMTRNSWLTERCQGLFAIVGIIFLTACF